MAASTGAEFFFAYGWPSVVICRDDPNHQRAGGGLRALLHVAQRSSAALLLVFIGFYGGDARRRAFGQLDSVGYFLGANHSQLIPVDWLLASSGRCAPWCADGVYRDRHRWFMSVVRRAAAGSYCGQLSTR